jgi:lipopolysaccharide/colanic/teichoic acid biosynthesis glycosyltransferase
MNKFPHFFLNRKKHKQLVFINLPSVKNKFRTDNFELVYTSSKTETEIYSYLETADCIIADSDFLIKNDFYWTKEIKKHSHSVVIAIAKDELPKSLTPSVILRNGIDDCYSLADCTTDDILKRIEFLVNFKQQSAQQAPDTTCNLKLPKAKRVFDVVLALIVILLLAPIFLITAILIRLESKGPIIYRSKRCGQGYKPFNFYKFRSMYIDAEARLRDLQHLNQYAESTSVFVKIKDDPRITKVGKFIRKYSIDELPQLFNVLLGDMSIIGNRPLPLYEAELLTKDESAYRFIAPAGITGLWQVTKRGGKEMLATERIQLDTRYAQELSFWLDLKILLKTPFAVVQKENV